MTNASMKSEYSCEPSRSQIAEADWTKSHIKRGPILLAGYLDGARDRLQQYLGNLHADFLAITRAPSGEWWLANGRTLSGRSAKLHNLRNHLCAQPCNVGANQCLSWLRVHTAA